VCFSPEADLAGAVVVGVIGVDAVRHASRPRDLALASLPLLFAAHSFTETFVWWGLQGDVSRSLGRHATWLYLFVALVVVPILAPVAVTLAEPRGSRRRFMTLLSLLGVGVGLVMLVAVVSQPLHAQIQGHHISYSVPLSFGTQLTVLYVIATCGVLLSSSSRRFVIFGLVNLVAVGLLAWLMTAAFISLWCGWAAVTSIAIDLHLRRPERPARPVDSEPGGDRASPTSKPALRV
jgi:uncharacterized membrane protein (DUF485 family)